MSHVPARKNVAVLLSLAAEFRTNPPISSVISVISVARWWTLHSSSPQQLAAGPGCGVGGRDAVRVAAPGLHHRAAESTENAERSA